MTDKLGREELLERMKAWKSKAQQRIQFIWYDDDEQAHKQIKALIQEPQVTEEWIHEKQKAWTDGYWQLPDRSVVTLFGYTQHFIRSLVEEIRGK